MEFHSSGEIQEEVLPIEWYDKVFPKITELICHLKHVDIIHGRLVNVNDGYVIVDEDIQNKMHTLKSLDFMYVGSHEWVKVDGKTAIVGITNYAQDYLGDAVYVELPEVGAVESAKATSDVYYLVSGDMLKLTIGNCNNT
ncbi:glycine cleavage system protein [Salix suchowensis]|nr:glycine cleavage system protein [Salix suchowensis]